MQGWNRLWGTLVVVGLLFSTACTHEAGVQASSPNFSSTKDLPFARASDRAGISPTASLAASEIPSGTPITVRIESQVSSASSRPEDAFSAVLDVPIDIDGQTIAPSGSAVAGKVVEAGAASPTNDFGYVRLTLTSISVDGKSLPVQTANIFVKAAAPYITPVRARVHSTQRLSARDVEFPAERRLTFRLTQPVPTR